MDTPWRTAGALLDAFSRRDFADLAACLAPDIRFRALVPPGPFDLGTPAEVAARFERWFGGEDEFEVVDATVGQVGSRMALRWRVRLWPPGHPASARIVEQHVYASGPDRITAMDLLCSGFHAENSAPGSASVCSLH